MNHNLTVKYKRCSAFASKVPPSSSSSGQSSFFSGLASGVRRPASSSGCLQSFPVWRLSSAVRRLPCVALWAKHGPSSAFTLIELLVVIVVIAILMGITIPVSKYAILRAKAARQEVMLAKIRSALDDYRATYGEYPITPTTNRPYDRAETSKHYWDNVMPDIATFSNSDFTNINLSTNTVETLYTQARKEGSFSAAKYSNDYSLTFPLMIRQEREGKRPFMSFKKVTVMSQIYQQYDAARDRTSYYGRRKLKGGGVDFARVYFAWGYPVDRDRAIDPVSGLQWKYTCYDGTSYTITTNTF